jgi:virulence-associated protein VapD
MQDNKLKIHFEYCYGIKKIDYEFDFSHQKYFSIYSPNGLMKTSFAQTFKDFSEKKNSLDRVFTAKQTVRNITDGTNSSIDNEEIFVIEPYNQDYKSDKISTLIANKILKEKYDKIYNDIDEKKQILIKYLQKTSGVKDKIDEEISFVFTKEKGEFFKALTRIAKEIEEGEKSYLSDIKYMEIFNEKVIALLKDENFKRNIEEYMECYDKLIIESNFFKKGVFNHNNASDIAKNLKNNGFFLAEHSVYLNRGGVKKEVSTVEELEDVINQEKNNILEDSKLLKLFNNIDDTLKKNKELKAFREYLKKIKKLFQN